MLRMLAWSAQSRYKNTMRDPRASRENCAHVWLRDASTEATDPRTREDIGATMATGRRDLQGNRSRVELHNIYIKVQ